jgi:oligosaccharide repeat unit polymerase
MRGSRVIELRQLFAPLTLVFVIYVPLLLLFLVTSPATFASEFNSAKHLTTTSFLYWSAALLSFAAGAALGRPFGLRRPLRPVFEAAATWETYRRSRLLPFVRGLMVLSLVAYLGWFAVGMARAGGPGPFIHTWLTAPFTVKTVYLRTVPGLTTLTQIAVAAIPLAFAFGLLHRGSRLRPLVVWLVVLAAARSFVFSERLAMLEIVIPLVFLALADRRVVLPKAVLYGIGLVLAILIVFTVTELRRTYSYTHNATPTRVTARFFGYYLTGVNNGSMAIDDYPAATPFGNTGAILWKFPVLSSVHADGFPGLGTLSLRYNDLFGKDLGTFWNAALSQQGLSQEYNAYSTPGYMAGDFGWFALPALLLLGLYSGALYTRSRSSSFHRALYAVWLIGLLEFMRIMYFFDTRTLPAYLAFAAVYVSIARRARYVSPVPRADARAIAAPSG